MRKFVSITACLILLSMAVLPFQASSEEVLEESPSTIWTIVNSYQFEMQILPGEDDGVFLDGTNGEIPSPTGHYGLPDPCWDALDIVPAWIHDDLFLKFRVLPSNPAVALANEILAAEGNETLDEIAFTAAHLSVETIMNDYFFPQIITDNAELVYSHDELVPYAEIVEKEDYTTIVYNTTEGELELPRDIYYWFVVHPDLGDEIPTYVDPDYNYAEDQPRDRDYGVPPPEGKFWRDWFFVNNKSGQPLLPDLLNTTETLLDGIKAINNWIDRSMTFTSDNERPNQPVRIYEKGIGRCGEYQDMRSSAARAALIPVVPTSNSAEDHVWNEFWLGEWVHWDGMINNPTAYEKGWGKTLSTVWNQRGDGYTWDVTDKYTEVSTIEMEVVDQAGLPADGTLVELKTENFYAEDLKTTTNFATTDYTGKLSFMVGDQRNYWGVSDGGDLGKDPLNPNIAPKEIAMNTTVGAEYAVKFELPRAADLPIGIVNDEYGYYDIQASINFTVVDHITRGRNPFTGDTFEDKGDSGDISALIIESSNMQAYRSGAPFIASYFNPRSTGDSIEFPLWDGKDYSLIFDNQFSQRTVKTVNVTIDFYGLVKNEFNIGYQTFEAGSNMTIKGVATTASQIDSIHVMIEDQTTWIPADINPSSNYYPWIAEIAEAPSVPGNYSIWSRLVTGNITYYDRVNLTVIDTTSPRVSIDSVTPGPYHDDDTITIEGWAEDAHRIEKLFYIVDGDRTQSFDMKVPREGTWSLLLDLSNIGYGDHSISIIAEDPSGNQGSSRIDLDIIEGEPPVVNLNSPNDGTIWRLGDIITLDGFASDNVGLESVSLIVDGRKVADITSLIQRDGKFTYLWNTGTTGGTNGVNELEVRAEDPSGNTYGSLIEVELDGIAPDLTLYSPGTVLFGPSSPYTLEGTVTDENGISLLEWSVDGINFEDVTRSIRGGGDFELEIGEDLASDEGDLDLSIRAYDSVGNMETSHLSLFFDPSGPVIDIVDLPEIVLRGDNVIFRGTVEDPSGLGEVIFSVDGIGEIERVTDLSSYAFDIDFDTSDLKIGSVSFHVESMDALGNWNEGSVATRIVTETTDSDGDGMPDWWEYLYGLDIDRRDGAEDLDQDGYTNLQEYLGKDRLPGNEDFSDPKDISSTPKTEDKSDGSGSVLGILLLLIIGIICLAIAVFIVARITKKA